MICVGTWELEVMRDHLRDALSRVTASLIQQLTKRDRLLAERERHCDVITAILQAASPKRSKFLFSFFSNRRLIKQQSVFNNSTNNNTCLPQLAEAIKRLNMRDNIRNDELARHQEK